MGYYTTFRLNTTPLLSATEINGFGFDGLEEVVDEDEPELLFGDSVKWYNHENEMRAASLKYPRVVFILDGEGEETGDIWRKFFLAGDMAVWRPDCEPPPYSLEIFKKLPRK